MTEIWPISAIAFAIANDRLRWRSFRPKIQETATDRMSRFGWAFLFRTLISANVSELTLDRGCAPVDGEFDFACWDE